MTDQPEPTTPDIAFGRPFALIRTTDVSGVSGTGHVADGVLFPDGHAVIHWTGSRWPTTTPHPGGMESVLAVHGHDGATRVRWQSIQGPPPADYQSTWTELMGYVQEAIEDGGQIDPQQFYDYLREKRREALAPVREWMNAITAKGTEEPTP